MISPEHCEILKDPLSNFSADKKKDEFLLMKDGSLIQVLDHDIPLFAEKAISHDAQVQQKHYDKVATNYMTNLGYPHTQEYHAYLDQVLLNQVLEAKLGKVAEICCGHADAFSLVKDRTELGVGVDISTAMLMHAKSRFNTNKILFVQGDATQLPLTSESFDHVFMLGGIHHVLDRKSLFSEIQRILKPGGKFFFREPVSDFIVWKALRGIIYRLSPGLSYETEAPLHYSSTKFDLESSHLKLKFWHTYGFLGFCLFMNSDILIFNRLFRFIPGIRSITRFFTRLDDWTGRIPGLSKMGLQVIGVAVKPD